MPAEHCPRCGRARTAAGCVCSSDSSVADTAVLPHLEGPPLVRPYVAAAVEHPAAASAHDPFATRLSPAATAPLVTGPVVTGRVTAPPAGPPVPPPPTVPPQVGPVPPQHTASADATALLPAAGGAHAWQPGAPADGDAGWAEQDQGPDGESWEPAPGLAADLGMFAFHDEPAPAPGSRAKRRERRQESANRRRLVIVGAAVGLAAVGAGLAFALTPGSSDHSDSALPAPTGPALPSAADPFPSTDPTGSSSGTATGSPSAGRTTKPATASKAPAAPTAAAPTSPASATASRSPSASASASTAVRDLRRGDEGADVSAVQAQLAEALFWRYDSSLVTGSFDKRTEQAVRYFQQVAAVFGEDGWVGPKTRTALANYT